MSDIENPESEPVKGEHPVFGSCSPGCRVFDAGSNAVFYELGDTMEGGELRVAAKNESLVLLEPVRIRTGIPEVDSIMKDGIPPEKLVRTSHSDLCVGDSACICGVNANRSHSDVCPGGGGCICR
jgi:hypothetical protein